MLRRGLSPAHYRLLPLDEFDLRLFAGDLHARRSSLIDWEYGQLLHDKLLFEIFMREHVRVPRNLVWIRNGKPTWLSPADEGEASLGGLLRLHGELIVKPKDRLGGKGVELLEFREGVIYRDGVETAESAIGWDTYRRDERLVSEYVHQGEFARSLYPRTVNTLRVITMLDPADGSAFVPGAYFRIGCAESYPTDNTSRGGYFCNVDVESGRLSKAVVDYLVDRPFQWLEKHPETGVVFEDVVIPDFSNICDQLVEAALAAPMLPYVSWDVAILDDGISVIEGNHWSDLVTFQFSKPLLIDERVRRFFEYHNVL